MKSLVVIILLLFPVFAPCQSKQNYFDKFIKVNYTHIDTTNVEILAMVNIWKSFIINRLYGYAKKNDSLGNKYWNDDEKQISSNSDHISSLFPGLLFSQTTVLNIEPVDDGYFKILNCNTDIDSSGNLTMKAIYYVLIKKIGSSYKLFNYFYRDKGNMNTTTKGNVQYYYPKYYRFSKKRANELIKFEDSLSLLFDLPALHKLTYIIDTNGACLIKHFGCIYLVSYYTNQGGQYLKNHKMILTSFNEDDRHELTHYFTTTKYPNKMAFFDEGMATYFGGSMGYNLTYHAKKLHKYLLSLNVDTINLLKLKRLDQETDPFYIFGAIVIKYAVENFGIQKAMTLLSYPQKQYTPEDVIEKELGIPKTKLNAFFMDNLKKYSSTALKSSL